MANSSFCPDHTQKNENLCEPEAISQIADSRFHPVCTEEPSL